MEKKTHILLCRQCIARCSSHVFQIIRYLSRHKSHSFAWIQLEAPKPCTNSQLTDLEPNTSRSWSLSMTWFLHVLAMDWCCSCTKMTSQKHHEMVMKWKWTVTKNHPASDWMWSVIALFCYVLLWYVVHLIAHRNRISPKMSSDIDSVLISCYKIQYVFGSPCPFESVFLSAESTAVGRIFMD